MLKRKAVILTLLILYGAFAFTEDAAAHIVTIPPNVYFHLWQQDTYINFASTTNLESIALESNKLCLDQYWFSVENANLTISKFFMSHHLTFIVESPVQSTSIARVYVGDRGEPTSVYAINGTLTWGYEPSTKILVLTIAHTNPAEITVDWGILGDLDNDGDVDSNDLSIFASAYGSDLESESYNQEADIDKDGNVDAHDLYLLAGNYGETSY